MSVNPDKTIVDFDELGELDAKQYIEDDDDEYSPLGAEIFEMITGSSIDDVMDAEDMTDEEIEAIFPSDKSDSQEKRSE